MVLERAKKKILIAIDNGIIKLDLTTRIRKNGYEAEIVKALTKEKILESDLIILDKSMDIEYQNNKRFIDGFDIPVIFITTHKEETLANHLVMPFLDNELLKAIRLVIEKK
jgi:hypothetical protein